MHFWPSLPAEWWTALENKLQICKMENIPTKVFLRSNTIAVKRSGEFSALFEKFSMHFPVDINWCQHLAMNYCRKSWKLSRSERWYFMIHCRMFVSFHSLCSFVLRVTKKLILYSNSAVCECINLPNTVKPENWTIYRVPALFEFTEKLCKDSHSAVPGSIKTFSIPSKVISFKHHVHETWIGIKAEKQ